MAKTLLPMWPSSIVESVCEVLADTATGLTGDEIGRLLDKIDVHDIDSSATKRHRLSYALLARQQRDQAGNCIVRFIAEAMAPGRHFKDPTRRQNIQDGLNERLLLMGLKVREDGKVAKASQMASTVDEAVRIAGRLKTELVRRGTHPEVLRYCEEELVRRSIFHAVFEAAKGLAARLRQLGGSTLDGSKLVDYCFGAKTGKPVLRINDFRTESDESEHSGFRQPPAWDLRHLPQPAGTHSPGDPGVDDHRSRRPRPILDAVVRPPPTRQDEAFTIGVAMTSTGLAGSQGQQGIAGHGPQLSERSGGNLCDRLASNLSLDSPARQQMTGDVVERNNVGGPEDVLDGLI